MPIFEGKPKRITMPHQFQVFERIAFSLVVLSAVVCSAFIAYESNPEVKSAVEATKNINWAADYSAVCTSPLTNPCAQFPGDGNARRAFHLSACDGCGVLFTSPRGFV